MFRLIACTKRIAGRCTVASDIAGRTVNAHEVNCQLCLQSDTPQQDNQFIRGLIRAAGGMPRSEPKFPYGDVGFVVPHYWKVGGTETWHQSLVPRVNNVTGFVSLAKSDGDYNKLGCMWAEGVAAARELAMRSKVLIVWGLGLELRSVVDVRHHPRVISVSHCDESSAWTTQVMHEQAALADISVAICPSGMRGIPDGHRSKLIANAVDGFRVKATTPRHVTRRRLGIDVDKKVLLSLSRISEEKRLEVLVDAMGHMPNEYHLVIAGPDSASNPDYAASLRAKSGANITWLGNVDPPADILAASDAMLSASTFEGWGLSMGEAMLAGVPVIATQFGLLEARPDMAYIVPPDSTSDTWAAAIRSDFAATESQTHRAALAKQFIGTECDVDRWAARWQRLIDREIKSLGRRDHNETMTIIDQHCRHCDHFAKAGCGGGCDLMRTFGRSPCQTTEHIFLGGSCPASEPRF